MIEGEMRIDARGEVSFVNGFNFKGVKRFYVVSSGPLDSPRGWHGHEREGKYVFVVHGVAAIGYVPLKGNEPKWEIMRAIEPKIFYIPPGYANTSIPLSDVTKVIYFSTSTLAESKKDDIRFPLDTWDIKRYVK